jgi:hypothetical protein
MLFRILIIAFLLFLLWRLITRDLVRLFRKVAPRQQAQMDAIDTIQCPHCHAYVPSDSMRKGTHADCPFPEA